jgi:hypothetical protein
VEIINRWGWQRTGGLVDETFNRATRSLEEWEMIHGLATYCHGVARVVFLKSLERHSNMENEKWIRSRQICLPRIHLFMGECLTPN